MHRESPKQFVPDLPTPRRHFPARLGTLLASMALVAGACDDAYGDGRGGTSNDSFVDDDFPIGRCAELSVATGGDDDEEWIRCDEEARDSDWSLEDLRDAANDGGEDDEEGDAEVASDDVAVAPGDEAPRGDDASRESQ